ncbi:MAG: choice-of-anchor L domain-containing protein [Polyangiaceae bacterium]|nr:choice-of-anchor L domain-containing protein [Polyangiaceae bacterium]MCW5790608.1 choice-of-anchor L domain-containing protein [Polyangiaceae bacterium]
MRYVAPLLVLVPALGLGCSDASGGSAIERGGSGAGAQGGSGGGSGAQGGSSGDGFGGSLIPEDDAGGSSGSGGSGGGILQGEPPCTAGDPNVDRDGDGFTPAQGDCNDCTELMNPGAFDFPGNNVDEDCDGVKDNEPDGCSTMSIDLASTYPGDALSALDLCRAQSGDSWGVRSVAYVKADGTNGMNSLSHGILPSFGAATPRRGNHMLALSSGTARAANQPGYRHPSGGLFGDMGTRSGLPVGFPVPAPACPGVQPGAGNGFDPAAIELRIKAPTNANALKFDFMFYTFEFPEYICSEFNDFFVALMDPAPPGAISANVSFDSQGNPVSVNNGYLEVCQSQTAGGKHFPCPQGTALLAGTGFEPAASTGWLQTVVPIVPGQEYRLRFAIWDAGDDILNSTVLIDNLTFDVTDASVPITEPPPK